MMGLRPKIGGKKKTKKTFFSCGQIAETLAYLSAKILMDCLLQEPRYLHLNLPTFRQIQDYGANGVSSGLDLTLAPPELLRWS